MEGEWVGAGDRGRDEWGTNIKQLFQLIAIIIPVNCSSQTNSN